MKAVTLGLAVVVMGVVVFASGPIAQDPAYHVMADRRSMLGVPNALNVLSNLPFLFAGLIGLAATISGVTGWTRQPYIALFGATIMVTAGSTYYHLAPDNARLVWDRLPMAVGFAALLTATLAERVSLRTARRLFIPLVGLSAASVMQWYWSESGGNGDLRLYGFVQFGSLLIILLILLIYREQRPGTTYLIAALSAYGAAKLFELADRAIFEIGHVVSGHTLKHLVAAAAIACLAFMLRARRRVW
jgi:hypothetical protein